MNIEALVRKNIREMKPYSSARDEFSGTGSIYLDANENPVNTGLNRYPDPYHNALREQISKLRKISKECIFLGNGSDEPIDLLIRLFCTPGKDAIITLDPSYGMYKVAAAINDVAVVSVPLNEDFALSGQAVLDKITDEVRIVFLCSPNNPSGNLLDPREVRKIVESFDGIVVLDEAYIDFADSEGFLPSLTNFPNLVILQTFSKAWGMAGVRVGMAFADPLIIDYLNKIKPPYNLNVLSQSTVLSALEQPETIRKNVLDILQQRGWLADELRTLASVHRVFPSDSNFLLVRMVNAGTLFRHLMAQGIIVRDRSNVTHGTDCLRLTIGTPEENNELLTAIKNFYI